MLLIYRYIPLFLLLKVFITLLSIRLYLEILFTLESNHLQALCVEYIFLFPYLASCV
jgi:hypothetical protein